MVFYCYHAATATTLPLLPHCHRFHAATASMLPPLPLLPCRHRPLPATAILNLAPLLSTVLPHGHVNNSLWTSYVTRLLMIEEGIGGTHLISVLIDRSRHPGTTSVGGPALHSLTPDATVPLDRGLPPRVAIPFLRRGSPTRIFSGAQNNDQAHRSAPSAWAARRTISTNAAPVSFGTDPTLLMSPGAKRDTSQTQMGLAFVTTGKGRTDVQTRRAPTGEGTSVQDVEKPAMGPRHALVQRTQTPLTPYKAEAWRSLLISTGLISKYPSIPRGLVQGFDMGFPRIIHTYSPPNLQSSRDMHEHLMRNINHELEVGRYIGPFKYEELEKLIRPFQSSPLSVIPKPGKPGKYRIIQNFSFPYSALNNNIQSINSQVNPDDFPCTWGTFDTICQVVQYLPAGLQAAVQDVAEAYQTIPLHPSQWPGAVVRLSDESLVVDTNLGFGYGPAAGGYGHLGDAGSDIMRAHGIGPLSKWVDDTIFFRIPKVHLEKYNAHRKECARRIQEHGGRVQEGCRTWY